MKLLPEVMHALVAANPGIAVSEQAHIARVVSVEWCDLCELHLPADHDCAQIGRDDHTNEARLRHHLRGLGADVHASPNAEGLIRAQTSAAPAYESEGC